MSFFTVSRKLDDSSPKTMRPWQSTTSTPSTVRVLILSCTGALLLPAKTGPFPAPKPIAKAQLAQGFPQLQAAAKPILGPGGFVNTKPCPGPELKPEFAFAALPGKRLHPPSSP